MITDNKKALLYLVQMQQGSFNNVQSQIDSELLKRFEVLGFIRHVDDKWQITSIGIKQSLFYRDPTPEEKEQGRLMHKLGVH